MRYHSGYYLYVRGVIRTQKEMLPSVTAKVTVNARMVHVRKDCNWLLLLFVVVANGMVVVVVCVSERGGERKYVCKCVRVRE